jgi:hypothetical protein
MHGVGGHAGNHLDPSAIPARTSSAPPADTAASYTHKRVYLPVKTGSAIVRGFDGSWLVVLLVFWVLFSFVLFVRGGRLMRLHIAHACCALLCSRQQMATRQRRPPATACNIIPVSQHPAQ